MLDCLSLNSLNSLNSLDVIMEDLLPRRGDYRNLLTYQKATAIYDITFYFAHKFLAKNDRTVDQMIQAARSGKQNIVEGSAAAITSKETEIKLTNVAKASLKELLEDYEDYLRTRNMRQWEQDSIEMAKMRELGRTHNDSAFYMQLISTRGDETIANIAIVLLKQLDYLLYKQLQRLSQEFIDNGGFKERMSQCRRNKRGY